MAEVEPACGRSPSPRGGLAGPQTAVQFPVCLRKTGSTTFVGVLAATWRNYWYELGVGWKLPTLAVVLWVVALTLWANIAAGVIKGPWGLLVGAMCTALAAVTAGYVPGIRDAVLRRRSEQARLEQDEAAAGEALRRAGELPGDAPAGLLDPSRGLVGFIGRERELAGLLAWCEDGRPRGARLVSSRSDQFQSSDWGSPGWRTGR